MSEKHEQLKWSITYRDTFDRDTPPMVEVTGTGLTQGLSALWKKTLREGYDFSSPTGETFSQFFMSWEEGGTYPTYISLSGKEAFLKKLELLYRRLVAGDMDLIKQAVDQQIEGYKKDGVSGIYKATDTFLRDLA